MCFHWSRWTNIGSPHIDGLGGTASGKVWRKASSFCFNASELFPCFAGDDGKVEKLFAETVSGAG